MDRLSAPGTVSAAGRATPSRGRPAELNDRDWLVRQLATKGERQIATELGCNRKTVRAAIERLSVAAASEGRRRGDNAGRRVTDGLHATTSDHPTVRLVVDRFERERKPRGPAATEDLLVGRLRAAHEARAGGDEMGYDGELIGIASAAMLIHEHRQQLRKAA